jgi:hypothetical protein
MPKLIPQGSLWTDARTNEGQREAAMRPNATMSASPKATTASADAGVKPPAAIKVRENFGRRC